MGCMWFELVCFFSRKRSELFRTSSIFRITTFFSVFIICDVVRIKCREMLVVVL